MYLEKVTFASEHDGSVEVHRHEEGFRVKFDTPMRHGAGPHMYGPQSLGILADEICEALCDTDTRIAVGSTLVLLKRDMVS